MQKIVMQNIKIKTFKFYIDLAIWLVIVLSCLYIAKGQPPSYPFVTPPPPAVLQVSTNVVGNQGNQTYYYFVVARYPIGQSQQSQGTITRNAPVTLSMTNFILVTWQPPQSATGFDVIRLTIPNFPGTCTACLIASNTSNTSVSDVSNATLGSYTLSSAPGASAIEYLDNLTGTIPTIRLDGVNGQNIAFAPGATINVDFGGANNTRPAKVVTALPAASGITCQIGSLQFYTLAVAGANLYVCASGTGYTAVNGSGGSTNNTKLCVQAFAGVLVLDFTSCAVIEVTLTANVTALSAIGQSVNSTFGGVIWIQGGAGGFTLAGVDASLVGWCQPQLVVAKHTVQSFIYDGIGAYSSGCVDSDTISNTIVINGFTYTLPGVTSNLESVQDIQAGGAVYCRSTTGNDTYTCISAIPMTLYTTGGCRVLNPDTANTLTATLNVDGLGAKSILNRAGAALATGDITANKPITLCYDGTSYIIQGDGAGGSGLITQHLFLEMGRGAAAAGVATGGRWSGLAATADPICFGTSPFIWCGMKVGTTGVDGAIYAVWDQPANQTGNVNLLADVEVVGAVGTGNLDVTVSCVVNGAVYVDNPIFGTPVTGTISSAATTLRTIVTFNNINTCAVTDQVYIRFRRLGAADTLVGDVFLRGADLVYQTLN